MPKIKRRILSSDPFIALTYRFIRIYSRTLRLTIEGEDEWMRYLESGGRVLICAWHQQFFAAIGHFRSYRQFRPSLMISPSSDGDLIAGVAIRTGWEPVRGSSSRQGRAALYLLIEKLQTNRLAAHILDGPRGPAGIVKPGVIRLAQAAGAAIVPFSVKADRAWFFKSWDRFMLPKPFARVTLCFGSLIRFEPASSEEDFERQRLRLEAIMRPDLKIPGNRT